MHVSTTYVVATCSLACSLFILSFSSILSAATRAYPSWTSARLTSRCALRVKGNSPVFLNAFRMRSLVLCVEVSEYYNRVDERVRSECFLTTLS